MEYEFKLTANNGINFDFIEFVVYALHTQLKGTGICIQNTS